MLFWSIIYIHKPFIVQATVITIDRTDITIVIQATDYSDTGLASKMWTNSEWVFYV